MALWRRGLGEPDLLSEALEAPGVCRKLRYLIVLKTLSELGQNFCSLIVVHAEISVYLNNYIDYRFYFRR
jgi:hypothetical protein